MLPLFILSSVLLPLFEIFLHLLIVSFIIPSHLLLLNLIAICPVLSYSLLGLSIAILCRFFSRFGAWGEIRRISSGGSLGNLFLGVLIIVTLLFVTSLEHCWYCFLTNFVFSLALPINQQVLPSNFCSRLSATSIVKLADLNSLPYFSCCITIVYITVLYFYEKFLLLISLKHWALPSLPLIFLQYLQLNPFVIVFSSHLKHSIIFDKSQWID